MFATHRREFQNRVFVFREARGMAKLATVKACSCNLTLSCVRDFQQLHSLRFTFLRAHRL